MILELGAWIFRESRSWEDGLSYPNSYTNRRSVYRDGITSRSQWCLKRSNKKAENVTGNSNDNIRKLQNVTGNSNDNVNKT